MVEKEKIKQDFSFLKNDKNVKPVLLFGSRAKNAETKKSDFDICIVAPNAEPNRILRRVWKNLNVSELKYDIYIFEEPPLYMKIEVIQNHEVIFASDIFELYEYFRFYTKLWNDQKHRNELSEEELNSIIESLNKKAKELRKRLMLIQKKSS